LQKEFSLKGYTHIFEEVYNESFTLKENVNKIIMNDFTLPVMLV